MITLIILAIALVLTIGNALGKLPLWPAVLVVIMAMLLAAGVK